MRTLTRVRPFNRRTNLYGFIREIAPDILTEEIKQEDGDCRFLQSDGIDDPLTPVLRAGARQLLAQAVELEVETFLAERQDF